MTKTRIPIPSEIAAAVLFASDHTCCNCRERGRPAQIHHIDEEPSNNDIENLAVLCLLCHNETQMSGGFGRKLNADLVVQFRDDWLARVVSRRNKADALAAIRMSGLAPTPLETIEDEPFMGSREDALVMYVHTLPSVLAQAYQLAQPKWDTGVTLDMIQGSYDVIDVVVQMFAHLASWLPVNHFNGKPADEYFSQYVSTRFIWHRALSEPDGIGTGGTFVGPITATRVLDDVERAVNEVVTALLWGREGFKLKAWQRDWKQKG